MGGCSLTSRVEMKARGRRARFGSTPPRAARPPLRGRQRAAARPVGAPKAEPFSRSRAEATPKLPTGCPLLAHSPSGWKAGRAPHPAPNTDRCHPERGLPHPPSYPPGDQHGAERHPWGPVRTQCTPEHPLGTLSIVGAEPQGCRGPDLEAPPCRGSPLPGDAVGPRAAAPVAVTAEGPAAPVPAESRGASRAAPRLHLPAGAGRKHGCGFGEPWGGKDVTLPAGAAEGWGLRAPVGVHP